MTVPISSSKIFFRVSFFNGQVILSDFEYIGAPILGDGKYFGTERMKSSLFINKLHLHAYKIDLSSVYGKKMVVKAKLPDYFKDSLKTLGLNFKE